MRILSTNYVKKIIPVMPAVLSALMLSSTVLATEIERKKTDSLELTTNKSEQVVEKSKKGEVFGKTISLISLSFLCGMGVSAMFSKKENKQ